MTGESLIAEHWLVRLVLTPIRAPLTRVTTMLSILSNSEPPRAAPSSTEQLRTTPNITEGFLESLIGSEHFPAAPSIPEGFLESPKQI